MEQPRGERRIMYIILKNSLGDTIFTHEVPKDHSVTLELGRLIDDWEIILYEGDTILISE